MVAHSLFDKIHGHSGSDHEPTLIKIQIRSFWNYFISFYIYESGKPIRRLTEKYNYNPV